MSVLKKRIIPCLDVKNGQVVKGTHFQNLENMGDPLQLALQYERDGADEIVFLDISASLENRSTALEMVDKVARNLSIPFTLGGGLRSIDDVYAFLEAGADKIAMNTTAILEPDLVDQVALRFGSQCLVVAVDIKKLDRQFRVFSHGGTRNSQLEARSWCHQLQERGAGEILLTSMDRDGTGFGYQIDLTGELARSLMVPVIASGGARTPEHLLEAFREGIDAVLAARMFHSGSYSIRQVKDFLASNGIPIRRDSFVTNPISNQNIERNQHDSTQY